jgi:hypothetical protein
MDGRELLVTPGDFFDSLRGEISIGILELPEPRPAPAVLVGVRKLALEGYGKNYSDTLHDLGVKLKT